MKFIPKKVFYKRVGSLVLASLVLSGCAANNGKAKQLPVLKHSYSKSKLTAYSRFGFHYGFNPNDIFNIANKEPTKFKVNVYIGDNNGCKIIYTKDAKGATDYIKQTKSFDAYLSGRNVLLEVSCQGKQSNIDYKIIAYANGVEYDRFGSLSYLAESGGL